MLRHLWIEDELQPSAIALLDVATRVTLRTGGSEEAETLSQAQAIVALSMVRYDDNFFAQAPQLRILVRAGIGTDNVDIAAATRRGIAVCNTPDGPTESTAEHTVAMVFALAKHLKLGNVNLAEGKFGPRSSLLGQEVLGKTIGLIGLGRIGRRVAALCHAIGMNVIAFDPQLSPEQAAQAGAAWVTLDDLIAQSDFVSLHLPLTPQTHHLMDHARINRMKPGAYLLNLSRGGLVDEQALLEALDIGSLAGAGLDVFETEPPPIQAPLRNHPSVIATPHTASVTVEGRTRTDMMAVQAVLAFFRGEAPPNLLNPQVLEKHRT